MTACFVEPGFRRKSLELRAWETSIPELHLGIWLTLIEMCVIYGLPRSCISNEREKSLSRSKGEKCILESNANLIDFQPMFNGQYKETPQDEGRQPMKGNTQS